MNWFADFTLVCSWCQVGCMSLAGSGSNDNACGERNSDALHRAICEVTRIGVNLVAAAGQRTPEQRERRLLQLMTTRRLPPLPLLRASRADSCPRCACCSW